MLDREAHLELDRVHRVSPQRASINQAPRDVLCRVHLYLQREELLRKAWIWRTVEFDGVEIHVLPDVSGLLLDNKVIYSAY